jgi:outer membrane lipoprotein SlyB
MRILGDIHSRTSIIILLSISIQGCATGANLQSNVYSAGEVNQRQEAEVVEILAVLPAKVQVSNEEARRLAQTGGAVLGAIGGVAIGNNVKNANANTRVAGGVAGGAVGGVAGSLVPGTVLVDGVSLTYVQDGKTFNSAQVGKICEFKPGKAIVVSANPNETRIQANSTCPS